MGKWTPNEAEDTVDMCFCANAFEGNGKKWMLDEDIIVGFVNAAGVPMLQPWWSDTESGVPAGKNSLEPKNGLFTNENGVLKICFARTLSEGHNPLADGAKVIWATGPVIDGVPGYHGKDGHDDSGASQMHRSDEVP